MEGQNSMLDDFMRMSWQGYVLCAAAIFGLLCLMNRPTPPNLNGGANHLDVIQSVGSLFCVLFLGAALLSFLREKFQCLRYRKNEGRSGDRPFTRLHYK